MVRCIRFLTILFPCLSALACDHARDSTRRFETWTAVEDLRIGSADDPELAFNWVGGIEVGKDGTIYSLHPNDQMVRRFSAAGDPLGTIGRRGGGPGEFSNPLLIGWLGDTLWVYDGAIYRFSLFTPGGDFIRTVAPRVLAAQHALDRPARPSEVLPDGTLLGSTSMPSHLVSQGVITTHPVFRLDAQGTVLDTIIVLPVRSEERRVGK